jgi:hypothetical protein
MMAPEQSTSPIQQAPPDRSTLALDQLYQQALAIMFRDGGMDQFEKKSTFDFFQEVAARAQNGGVGNGPAPAAGPDQGPPQSPMQMNQDTQDMGTVDGSEPMNGTEGY